MTAPRRRRSWWAYEVAFHAIGLLAWWRYGLIALVAVLATNLLAYFQGIDRGVDIAGDAWRTAVRSTLR